MRAYVYVFALIFVCMSKFVCQRIYSAKFMCTTLPLQPKKATGTLFVALICISHNCCICASAAALALPLTSERRVCAKQVNTYKHTCTLYSEHEVCVDFVLNTKTDIRQYVLEVY